MVFNPDIIPVVNRKTYNVYFLILIICLLILSGCATTPQASAAFRSNSTKTDAGKLNGPGSSTLQPVNPTLTATNTATLLPSSTLYPTQTVVPSLTPKPSATPIPDEHYIRGIHWPSPVLCHQLRIQLRSRLGIFLRGSDLRIQCSI